MHEDPQYLKTNDMALVTLLKYEGSEVQEVVWDDDTCYWIFRITDKVRGGHVAFLDRTVRVEPMRYSAIYGQTKQEFYAAKRSNKI